MPSVFATYTVDDLRTRLNELKASDAGKEAKSSLAFVRGDHWQGSDAWVGPRPPFNHPNPGAFWDAIKKDLVSKNIVKETVRRDRNGVIGREPMWTITLSRDLEEGEEIVSRVRKKSPKNELLATGAAKRPPPEQPLIDEAEAALLAWWDTRRYGKKVTLATLQNATDVLNASGRGPLRFFIPPAKIDENGQLINAAKAVNSPAAALQLLYLMTPEYEQGIVITDPDTQEQAGVFITKAKDSTDDKIELCFLDDDGNTVIRIFEGDKAPSESMPYGLGGRLTIYEMNRDPLISPQVKQMQKLFNMSATMRTRAVGQAGFPERTFIGAKPPSHFEADPDNPGQTIEVADPYQTGGVTNFVRAQEILDEAGNVKGYAAASLEYRDPVKVETFDKTERAAYHNILSEVSQIHVAMTGDATTSGESRIQARADFVMALRETKTQVDAAGRWVLETALAWAAHLAGMPGRYAGLRVSFDSRLDPGPLSAEERSLVAEEVAKRLRSREDAMTLLGIDDPNAMLEKIISEEGQLNPENGINVERSRVSLERDKQNATGNPEEVQRRILAEKLALDNPLAVS